MTNRREFLESTGAELVAASAGFAQPAGGVPEIVTIALDAGINFFDNAWEYHEGRSEEWLGRQARPSGRHGEGVYAWRDKCIAMRMLEESLRRLRTDHLDVWQVHEVIYDNDPDLIFRANGAASTRRMAGGDCSKR